jgi:hypothetical protein
MTSRRRLPPPGPLAPGSTQQFAPSGLHAGLACLTIHPMLFLFLLRDAPGSVPIMGLTLLVAMYLTVMELRELRPQRKWWAWWLSLVFLLHFVGYLALRGYGVWLRRRDGARL